MFFVLRLGSVLFTLSNKMFICHRQFDGLIRVVTHGPFYYDFTTIGCRDTTAKGSYSVQFENGFHLQDFPDDPADRGIFTAYYGISGR